MRGIRRVLLALLLLIALAACGTVNQNQSQQVTHIAKPTATRSSSGISLSIPAQIAATPSPTPRSTAAPVIHPTSPPGSPIASQLEQQLFNLINQDRAAQGLYAYVLNSTMSTGARLHSVKMGGTSCGMSHQCPGEPAPCQRVSNEGISWTSCGENVGYSSPNPTAWAAAQGIEKDMLNEQPPDDGHRLNLLNTSYHRIGVGIYIDSRGYVWITEDFAS